MYVSIHSISVLSLNLLSRNDYADQSSLQESNHPQRITHLAPSLAQSVSRRARGTTRHPLFVSVSLPSTSRPSRHPMSHTADRTPD